MGHGVATKDQFITGPLARASPAPGKELRKGPLRGLQKPYTVAVYWHAKSEAKPYVVLREPRLRPREGKTFEEIPHLLFNSERPELSGLCLFDPNGNEWSNKLLIADTTMRWAAEWIYNSAFRR